MAIRLISARIWIIKRFNSTIGSDPWVRRFMIIKKIYELRI